MKQSFLARRNTKYHLDSLSFTPAHPSAPQQLPSGALRLIYPMSGACQLVSQGDRISLVGCRMVLLCGELSYHLEAVEDRCILKVLDFTIADSSDTFYSPYMLYHNHSGYYAYCQAAPQILVVQDSLGVVLSTLHTLHACVSAPNARPSPVQLELTLAFLMLYITSATYDDRSQDAHCSKHTRQAIRYLHSNYMQPLTTAAVAAHIGIHPNYLHRLFSMEMGTQPLKYLTELRLEKAKALLVDTKIPIAEIACHIGIPNREHFSKVFHSHVGMTPTQYRQSYNVTCDYAAALGFLEYAHPCPPMEETMP